jgi:hypothetical protein
MWFSGMYAKGGDPMGRRGTAIGKNGYNSISQP